MDYNVSAPASVSACQASKHRYVPHSPEMAGMCLLLKDKVILSNRQYQVVGHAKLKSICMSNNVPSLYCEKYN